MSTREQPSPDQGVGSGGGRVYGADHVDFSSGTFHGLVAGMVTAAPAPVLPPVTRVPATGLVGLPRRPAAVFVGRDDELGALGQMLAAGPGVIAQTVVGLGGIGKSELALHYALRHHDGYHLVWWIDAESPQAIEAGLAALCRALCAGVAAEAAAQASAETATAWALAWLAAHRRWLVVFDNVEDADHLQPYLGRLTGGQVLITSRRDTGWQEIGGVLRLGTLTRAAAVQLLQGLIAPAAWDPIAAAELAAELGELPLALKHAGAYIARTPGMTIPGYLHLLRTASARHAARPWEGSAEHAVARTWAVTMDRIAATDRLAMRLLRLLACYAPDDLPCAVLYGLAEDGTVDEIQVAETLGVLAAYSMINRSGDGHAVSVHRLVQAVTRTSMDERDRTVLAAEAAALLQAALPDDPDRITSWPAYARLLPHARIVLTPDSPGMSYVLAYLHASGDWRTARTLQQQHLEALNENLGPGHPETLTARHGLAVWTGEAGDAVAARELFAELLPVRERVLGADHPDTLTTRHGLAYWTGRAGDVVAARELFAELLPVRERVLGADHPDTLTTRNQLAVWTGRAGDAVAARELFAELLPMRERVLGADHPDTLTTRHGLARWTGEAGDAVAVCELFAELLPVRERVLGADHPNTLTTRHGLARWTGEAGDAAGARELLAALLPVRERVLGADHPDTLTTRHGLAYWTGRAGDAVAARELFAELLPMRERVLGADHPNTLTTRHGLARWTGEAGDATGARELLAALLPVRERVLQLLTK
ncbi:FxSxx-COOH system tetratricopeptide repeat protein [Planomonospora sp. ID91781]|uniref:FxSxx-COOH system tetratricopeptide repeat protein n=1 Tax=Planomonospora sp. ID91781 TaxID=2738135 RepID=UPI0018C35C40|nr:FxSxx-COOH system tetratricopeptide repeat protein [Planomonospora sp. ID91781]